MSKVTLTQEQLQAIIAQAVEAALAAQTSTKSANKKSTTSAKKSSTSKQDDKPKTKSEALDKAYGDKAQRTKFVAEQNKKAIAFLKSHKVSYTLNEYGKVQFNPFSEQKQFASRKEFTQFREDFRKQFPYA